MTIHRVKIRLNSCMNQLMGLMINAKQMDSMKSTYFLYIYEDSNGMDARLWHPWGSIRAMHGLLITDSKFEMLAGHLIQGLKVLHKQSQGSGFMKISF